MEKKDINWTLVVLVALLVIAVGYIGISEYSSWKERQEIQNYQQGYQQGMNDTAMQIAQTAGQCQTISLKDQNNETVTIVSLECVQEQMQQTPQQESVIENDSGSEELLGE